MTQHTASIPADVAPVLQELRDLSRLTFDVVDQVAGHAVRRLERVDCPRPSTLAGIDGLVSALIERPGGPVQGAGFVAAFGLFEDTPWWLAWYARNADGRAERLVRQTDPEVVGFCDYKHLPWYVVPRDTGRRHVTGPYVDYLCTDDYTVTFTLPIRVGGRFVGVAGADVGVRTVERLLLPSLGAADRRLVVVNAHGRIFASNSGHHLCGELLDEVDVSAGWDVPGSIPALHALEDLPLGVLELDALP